MRLSTLCTLVFAAFCLLSLPQQTQAQYVYGYDEVGYDSNVRYVYGYGATYLDYYAGWYYDPEVYVELYKLPENEIAIGRGYGYGYDSTYPAEVYNQSGLYRASTTYEAYSVHFVRPYYSYNYCFNCWYDPLGYSFFSGGGGYGGYHPWYSSFFNPNYYVSGRRKTVGTLTVRITTPPDYIPPPPAPTPTPICSTHTVQIIGGNRDITGTTANALLGAIVTLQAVIDGSGGQADGIYRWVYEDAQEGSNLSSVPNIKNVFWLSEGAKRVTVQFIPNGENCVSSATATVNVVVPTQYTFTAYQNNGRVRDDCSGGGLNEFTGTAFSLGCGTRDPGITFNATIQAPGGYISAPNDSGIKLVQLISQFITARGPHGELLCPSTQERSSEFDIDSGWRLDGFDPYGLGAYAPFTLTTPGDPNSSVSASVSVIDSPGVPIQDLTYLRTDLQFEMYLVYFAGDRENPRAQRVLAKIPWNWGGEITFSSPGFYSTFTSYPPSQLRNSVPTPMVSRISDLRAYRPYEGRRTSLVECSGVNPPPDPTPDPTPDPYPDPCYSGYRMNCY